MQTTVSANPATAREGLLVPSVPHLVISRVAETALPAGRVVVIGTSVGHARLPALTGEVTGGDALGVTLWDSGKEPYTAAAEYAAAAQVSVVRKGWIWMVAEDACAEGDAVFVRFSASGSEELGMVRSDADTADAVALPGAVFRSTTSGAAELILVELNLV